ncbi:MAG: YopX family protein [bacterium]
MKQRQFLFRAWRQKQQFMYDNVVVGVSGKIGYKVGKGIYEYEKLSSDVCILQYTGRRDKNGREIFEGDLLKVDRQESLLAVTWDMGKPGFALYAATDSSKKELKWPPASKIKICGNIFEGKAKK